MSCNITERLLQVLHRRTKFPQDLHDKFSFLIFSETLTNIVYICVYISVAIYLRLLIKDRADQIKVAEERRMKSAITEKPSKFYI